MTMENQTIMIQKEKTTPKERTAQNSAVPAKPTVRGRFAPTPSGRMHLGNVLCALLAWLSVRSQQGTMVLRIEDLDKTRTSLEFTRLIEEDLLWLGLSWDEGGASEALYSRCQPGAFPPYEQSKRNRQYDAVLHRLCEAGLVYPCFCSRSELRAASAPHESDKEPVYSGRCRTLSPEEKRSASQSKTPAMRLMVPDELVSYLDGHLGLVRQHLPSVCGDFIIRRSDGVYAYQLAVVADDAAMHITEVVRGRDLLASTPRQLYLYRLLGAAPPAFYHIPLLLSPDGKRLSKRDLSLDLGRLRQIYRPQDLIGLLAFSCGLTNRPRPVSADELIPLFSWENIHRENIYLPVDFF